MKTSPNELRLALRRHPRIDTATLCAQLQGINRSTLLRVAAQLGDEVIRLGGTRRSRYALRRPLRGQLEPIRLYRIDAAGEGTLLGALSLTQPEGSALQLEAPLPWPVDTEGLMRDGWFDGLPYPILDMRPQGFLGRNFAQQHWRDLQVPEQPERWSDEDIVHVLSLYGHDQPGDLILGDVAYLRHVNDGAVRERHLIADHQVAHRYPELAAQALAHGEVGSSAGGEFPKFTAWRSLPDGPAAVIVKFSGNDGSPAVQRWADLLVGEHLALETLQETLGVPTARSTLQQAGGRTFLEVLRFDRVGLSGRRSLCSLASLDGALLGMAGESWSHRAAVLQQHGWLRAADVEHVALTWWFGRLIANTDMHDGNLSFHTGLQLAPIYDMLPMRYAPQRGVELPDVQFAIAQPLPQERPYWRLATEAARAFWQRAAADSRISTAFRRICADNAAVLAG